MPRRVAITSLDASTLDILNVIRANADSQYRDLVPEVAKAEDVPKVGGVLYGYPALANQFVNALVNRIAQVRVKSAEFNNRYAALKKGYLEFGETVEEVFVSITKARAFNVEKAAAREFKRTLPDVKSAFHTMNWRVQYPITIQNEDLKMAFLSISGVEDLIAKIVGAVNTAAEYDEFLLFKYLIIKAVAHGKMKPVGVSADDLKDAAVKFRTYSNMLEFMSDEFNDAHVKTVTPKRDQYIFMDADFNAQFDVNVLASAFNMDKADFMGRLQLIDRWDTFDNDRFSEIRAESTGIEEVTGDELALMADVKAILVDGEWFQIYDELSRFSETYVASGLYWNYFYNVWKTVSSSPFSNAIVFAKAATITAAPATLTVECTDKSIGDNATVVTLTPDLDQAQIVDGRWQFVQTEQATMDGVAVHKYGTYMFPANGKAQVIELTMAGATYKGGTNTSSDTTKQVSPATAVGATFTLTKQG